MVRWEFSPSQRRHSEDGLLLAELVRARRFSRALDVGCGDGIVAHTLLGLGRCSRLVALDADADCIETARRNLPSTGVTLICRRVQALAKDPHYQGFFDLIVINPPFFKQGAGKTSSNARDESARRDSDLPLEDWVQACARLLKPGGEVYSVFQAGRIAELLEVLRGENLEPKEIWFHGRERSGFKRVWVRSVKGGKPGAKISLIGV